MTLYKRWAPVYQRCCCCCFSRSHHPISLRNTCLAFHSNWVYETQIISNNRIENLIKEIKFTRSVSACVTLLGNVTAGEVLSGLLLRVCKCKCAPLTNSCDDVGTVFDRRRDWLTSNTTFAVQHQTYNPSSTLAESRRLSCNSVLVRSSTLFKQ